MKAYEQLKQKENSLIKRNNYTADVSGKTD